MSRGDLLTHSEWANIDSTPTASAISVRGLAHTGFTGLRAEYFIKGVACWGTIHAGHKYICLNVSGRLSEVIMWLMFHPCAPPLMLMLMHCGGSSPANGSKLFVSVYVWVCCCFHLFIKKVLWSVKPYVGFRPQHTSVWSNIWLFYGVSAGECCLAFGSPILSHVWRWFMIPFSGRGIYGCTSKLAY